MNLNFDYKGSRIILRDEDSGETIAESSVTLFVREEMLIRAKINRKILAPYERLSVLIMTPKGVHEYLGTARGGSFTETEILLFKGKIKEERAAPRYDLNAMATVQFLSTRNLAVTISRKISVTILNISTNGALILAGDLSLFIDHPFRLTIPMGDKDMVVQGKILRSRPGPVPNMWSYGCRFIAEGEG